MRFVVGITGGIASGKSTVSSYLDSRGVQIIDADKISRNIMKKGKPAYDIVMREFPRCVKEGQIDRRTLGNIVFHDEQQLLKLNRITHPLIIEEIRHLLNKDEGLFVLDAALLFETGLNELCDKVICVTAPNELRIKRIIKRDGLEKEEAIARIKSQMLDEKRMELCDYVINSDKDIGDLYREVETIFDKMLKEHCK